MSAGPEGPFLLQISELREGEIHLERVGTAVDLALDPGFLHLLGPVVLRLAVYRAGERFEIHGTVNAPVELTCDRCLAPVRRTLDPEIHLFCERRISRDRRTDQELREEDLGIVYHNGRFIDLTDEVRQVLLVELPWHALCKEDCRGLCPQCGFDQNRGSCRCHPVSGDPGDDRRGDSRRSAADAEGEPQGNPGT